MGKMIALEMEMEIFDFLTQSTLSFPWWPGWWMRIWGWRIRCDRIVETVFKFKVVDYRAFEGPSSNPFAVKCKCCDGFVKKRFSYFHLNELLNDIVLTCIPYFILPSTRSWPGQPGKNNTGTIICVPRTSNPTPHHYATESYHYLKIPFISLLLHQISSKQPHQKPEPHAFCSLNYLNIHFSPNKIHFSLFFFWFSMLRIQIIHI